MIIYVSWTEDVKRKPAAFCTENIDHLRELLKQSETKFDDVSEILAMIINSGDEKNPEMNYKTHLDLVTDDLKNIKTKLSSLESKVKTIRKEYLNEVVSFFLNFDKPNKDRVIYK